MRLLTLVSWLYVKVNLSNVKGHWKALEIGPIPVEVKVASLTRVCDYGCDRLFRTRLYTYLHALAHNLKIFFFPTEGS